MLARSEPPLDEAGAASLRRANYRYFPVVPGRLEFAVEVRRALLTERPRVVAVELPSWLKDAYVAAVERLPEITVIMYPEARDPDQAVYLVVEPADPFTEAVRTGLEIGAEIVFLEAGQNDRPHLAGAYPDSYAVRFIGYERYVAAYRLYPQPVTEETLEHAAAVAWKLQGAAPFAPVFVVIALNLLDPVLEAMEQPQNEPPQGRARGVELLNPHPACLAEILLEYPLLQERYERFRESLAPEELADRRKCQWQLLKEAEVAYEASTGEKITHWQRRMMARFARNLAGINNQLAADLYDLTLAARSVVDDNYAWEVWDTANRYAWQREESSLETVNLSGEEVFLHTRKLRLRRRQPRPKRRLMPRGLKKRRKEQRPGEWAEQIGGDSVCSYPPEDLVIEEYGRFLKQKAKSMVSEERVRVEPFTTSLLDGIDIRETIRHWFEGQIYVRRCERLAGDVGAVIVIFDEDLHGRYTYLTTWLGEHQNESDMAFYSTVPFEHMVGPGIGRAEYGGFLMTLPPRRLFDVWSDPDYDFAETKAERLLLAGLDYSLERHVVYVAAKPPRSIFRSIAAHLNRNILYVPIGSLSPSKLKRIRVVHVLDSRARREIAKDYIW